MSCRKGVAVCHLKRASYLSYHNCLLYKQGTIVCYPKRAQLFVMQKGHNCLLSKRTQLFVIQTGLVYWHFKRMYLFVILKGLRENQID